MSRIRVNELINQGGSGPTLAVEGLKIPSTKNLEIDGSIILNSNPGLSGQVLGRGSTGLEWFSISTTDSNTTYVVSAVDGVNPVTDKVIKLTAGGSGGSNSEVVLVAGSNIALSRDGSRITIDGNFTDTDTVTKIGANGTGYTDGDVSIVGSGATNITQSGRTITVNSTDTNTTYTGANGVTINSENQIQIGQPVGTTDSVTFNSLVVSGNLTVQGTTTYSNVTTVTTTDKFIFLNDVLAPSDSIADGGGIKLKGTTEHTILWDNSEDAWKSSENWDLSIGKEYKINGISVIDSTGLGNTVVNSSLTSVGLLTSGIWNANTIGIAYGGTGATTASAAITALLPAQAGNSGRYLTTDGNTATWGQIPSLYAGWAIGDATVNVTIASNDILQVVGTGATTVNLDNTNKKLTVDSADTLYHLTVENDTQASTKIVRLTDSNSNAEEFKLTAGTGVTLTRGGANNNELTFSVAQDLSAAATPTFAGLTVTGTLDANAYTGNADQLSGLTGASGGTYGSANSIPIITVSPTGRITSIATTSVSGGGGGGAANAGGVTGSIQYNSGGGFAGTNKLLWEPGGGEFKVDGYINTDNIVSAAGTITSLSVLNSLKLPSKTTSERDALNVLNGTLVYNNSSNQVEMYQDGTWIQLGQQVSQASIGDLSDVDAETLTVGHILKWDGTKWSAVADHGETGGGGGGNADFSQLSVYQLNPSGPGGLTYSPSNGIFTYAPPDLSPYLTSYNETDPVFVASAAYNITNVQTANWNAAYQWGNHSSQGYLTNILTENLSDLFDVSNAAPSDGQVLKWSSAQNKWAPGSDLSGGGGIVGGLTAFSVSTGSPASGGGSLSYDNNGTFTFTPADVFNGDYNSLTNTPSLFDGTWNSLTGKPSVPSTLGTLTNVSTSVDSAADGKVLAWSDNDGLWVPTTMAAASGSDDLDTVTDRGSQTTNTLTVGGVDVSNDGTLNGALSLIDTGSYSEIRFRANSDTSVQGTIKGEANDMFITTANGYVSINTYARIYSNGNVEFNNGNNGTFKVSGLTYPSADGNPGQVMTTNGSGVVSFTNLASAPTSSDLHDVSTNGSTTSNVITVGGLDLSGVSHKLRFGPSQTLQIYHDTTVDEIVGNTVDLSLRTVNSDLLLGSTGGITKITNGGGSSGDLLAQFVNGGTVELYHNGTKRLETTATGVTISNTLDVGSITISGQGFKIKDLADVSSAAPSQGQILKWNANTNLYEPASDLTASGSGGINLTDLSVSTITAAGGGGLSYNSNTGVFEFTPAVVSAADTLDNVAQRGNTTTTSITAHGISSTNDITVDDSIYLKMGTGQDLQISHSGSANIISSPGGHPLRITESGGNRAIFNESGSVELFWNKVKKFETSSSGITISGEVTTTGGNSTNWNTAHGWGDHASAGYLTGLSASSLNDLSDVSTASPGSGQILQYNSSTLKWEAADQVIPPSGVEKGMIIIWSGSISNIPDGWALCDGSVQNGEQTPDLRDRFVVGASIGTGNVGETYSVDDTGGNDLITLTTGQMPSHSHGLNDAGHSHTATGSHTHGVTDNGHNHDVSDSGHSHSWSGSGSSSSHSHNFSTGSSQGSHSHSMSGSVSGNTGSGGNHGHSVSDPGHQHTAAIPSGSQGVDTDSHGHDTSVVSGAATSSTWSSGTGISIGSGGGHSHSFYGNVGGNTGNAGGHTHSGSTGSESPSVSVSGSVGSSNASVSVDSGVTSIGIDSASLSLGCDTQSTGATVLSNGSGNNIDIRPKYYALCYIMKVSSGSGSGGSGGGANVSTDDTAPATATDGDLWWDSTDGTLKIYYQDPDSSQWVSATPPLSQEDYIKLSDLKNVVAASSDFADFQTRIAAL